MPNGLVGLPKFSLNRRSAHDKLKKGRNTVHYASLVFVLFEVKLNDCLFLIMPNYDYVCLDCGDKFEAFQMMSADPFVTCEKCSGQLKRLIGTGAGFVFKGAPVSETDYRLSKSYKEGEKKESGSSVKSTSSGSNSKTEKKSVKKADSGK